MSDDVPRDYWTADGMIFVAYGEGYTVAPNGRTVCIGEMDGDKPIQKPCLKPSVAKKPVTKIAGNGLLPSPEVSKGIMLHHRGQGRPPKKGEVSRMTEYRRKKAEQGVLL